jgi:hypothetical protein
LRLSHQSNANICYTTDYHQMALLEVVECTTIPALMADKNHKLEDCLTTNPAEMNETRLKDARDTHACCGVVATYQNREGVRLAAGRRANTAGRHWTAAGHW